MEVMADRRQRRPSRRQVALWLGAAAGLALTARVLFNSRDELITAADSLTAVQPGWLVLAVVFEVVAYVCYARGLQRLFRRAGADVGLLPLTGISVLGQAAGNCLPGGLALTGVVMYRQLRRRGVADALTGWVLGVASVLFMVALALVALVALEVAGPGSQVAGLQAASLTVIALVVVLALAVGLLRSRTPWQRWAGGAARAVAGLPLLSRVWPRSGRDLPTRVTGLVTRLGAVRLGARAVLVATGLLVLSWLADAVVLGLAFTALGQTPPLRGLLLAYCAGQLAAALPVTPGGLGVVEGSLTLALVAFGGAEAGTLAAVLLYRLVSFWGLLPVGALCWLALHLSPAAVVPSATALEVSA